MVLVSHRVRSVALECWLVGLTMVGLQLQHEYVGWSVFSVHGNASLPQSEFVETPRLVVGPRHEKNGTVCRIKETRYVPSSRRSERYARCRPFSPAGRKRSSEITFELFLRIVPHLCLYVNLSEEKIAFLGKCMFLWAARELAFFGCAMTVLFPVPSGCMHGDK